jgi:L-threonylcarbamoyladenylate synthase
VSESLHTQVIRVDARRPDLAAIEQAAAILRGGGLVAFPTETVYGLGANALDAAAVQRIYQAKGRPANNPVIVHIAEIDALPQVAQWVPALAYDLAAAFWPGPLTLVLRRHERVPPNVSLGRETVAVRLPAHPVAHALIAAAGVPVAAPSANRFTRPSATTAQHVLADLAGRVDLILDAGPTPIGLESTVLDLTSTPPAVLRPGGVTLEALRAYIPDVQQVSKTVLLNDTQTSPASPGMHIKHYAPDAELLLFSGPLSAAVQAMRQAAQEHLAAGRRVGLLVADDQRTLFAGLDLVTVALGVTPEQIAQQLFSALRQLDEQGVDVILACLFEPVGLGVTLNDRLLRAAEGRLIVTQPTEKDSDSDERH